MTIRKLVRNTKNLSAALSCGLLTLSLSACQQSAEQPTALQSQAAGSQVELKWMLPDAQADLAREQLKVSSSDALFEKRTVYFYDTLNLDLYAKGLILRARKVKDGSDDSTVKFRPMTSAQAAAWLGQSGFKCELDMGVSGQVESCSFKVTQNTGEIDAVYAGTRTVDKLFSAEQEAFAAAKVAVPWSLLRVYGPTESNVWERQVSSLPYPFVLEQWKLPSGAVMSEFSVKAPADEAEAVRASAERYLQGKGLSYLAEGDSKTARVLSEWQARLR